MVNSNVMLYRRLKNIVGNAFFVAILTIAGVQSAFALDPILSKGKVWKYSTSNELQNFRSESTLEVSRATVIDGENLIVLTKNYRYYSLRPEELTGTGKRELLAREKDGVVWYYPFGIPKDDSEPTTIWACCDMKMKLGDTYEECGECEDCNQHYPETYYISYENEMDIFGKKRKVLCSQIVDLPSYGEEFDCWIEGIGPTNDRIWMCPQGGVFPTDGSEAQFLDECWENGELIYERKAFQALARVLMPAPDALAPDYKLYDLQGKPVDSPVKGQIYIRGGEKILWSE